MVNLAAASSLRVRAAHRILDKLAEGGRRVVPILDQARLGPRVHAPADPGQLVLIREFQHLARVVVLAVTEFADDDRIFRGE